MTNALRINSFGLRHSLLIRHSSFVLRHLLQLAFAQNDHADRRNQNQDTDNLKRKIVFVEEKQSDVMNVIYLNQRQRRKRFFAGAQLVHDRINLKEERECDQYSAGKCDYIYFAALFRPEMALVACDID